MNFSSFFKSLVPFIIGILIGGGFTKNKYVLYILISYVIFMFIFTLLSKKITNIYESQNKKETLKHEFMETINDVGEITLKGNSMGADLFDKYYKKYIFYMNLILFISIFVLAFFGQWLWALVCFLGLHFHMVLNQVVRIVNEIKGDKNING